MARYPFPWDLFLALSRDLPAGRRSLVDDAALMASRIEPKPVVLGGERIPPGGPLALAVNHYQRRGLWIAWPGAVVTAAAAERRPASPVHWLVTGGIRLFQWKRAGPVVPGAEHLFRAVAGKYGMTALPLNGARPRAGSLRSWLRYSETGGTVALFPEGLAGCSEALRPPEAGFEGVCRLLARRGVPVQPVGVFERDDTLHIAFGHPLEFPALTGAGDRVMRAIAELLPAEQRGPYATARVGADGSLE